MIPKDLGSRRPAVEAIGGLQPKFKRNCCYPDGSSLAGLLNSARFSSRGAGSLSPGRIATSCCPKFLKKKRFWLCFVCAYERGGVKKRLAA